MKEYNDYMDNISVSDTLHRKFVSCAANIRTSHRRSLVRRYAAAFACLTVILLSIYIVPRLLQNNMVLTPELNSDLSQSDEYTLIFNKADGPTSAGKIYIPGHFWQELEADELQKVFPHLLGTHTVRATVNFKSEEGVSDLFNIDAHAVSVDGLETYIGIARGDIVFRCTPGRDGKTSDVLGTTVTAGYYESSSNSKGQWDIVYFASFKVSGVSYYAELRGEESESMALRDEFSSLIGLLIKGGTPDLSIFNNPVIPELRDDELYLNEAYVDPDFGEYLPKNVPSGFAFVFANRFMNQKENYLSVLWMKGIDDIQIHWRVSVLNEYDKSRITSVADKQNYDLSLYSVPYTDSVPLELEGIVNNPIFRIEDLTLEVVQARAYEFSDAGDISGPYMSFGILFGDTLVEIDGRGATPEEMFQVLQQIKK